MSPHSNPALSVILAAFVFLAGCSSSTIVVHLPLHDGALTIPRRGYVGNKIESEDFQKGYREGWIRKLHAYAADIDHRPSLMEDIGGAASSYWTGWRSARDDMEAMVAALISERGRSGAEKILSEAAAEQKEGAESGPRD